ncbi:unnamed protein product [Symbiodinium sp. CCMP2592]|nr:unnamed protein product [Symbiodinium sp. CCMP2592]
MANVVTQNRLQLGLSLLQLLVASVGQHHSWRDVSKILERCTRDCKGPPLCMTFGRQRDLLPLPLPAFGATLKLARMLKCPASGLVLWNPSITKQVGRQQLKKLSHAACVQTWRLLGVMILNAEATGWERLAPAREALEFLGRQCEWWSRRALEVFHVRGEPVLNGVFAVEKSGTPSPGVLLWSGDDQKGAFYAWRLPGAWRGLMTFKMPVPGEIVGRPDVETIYVAAAVIPMGWRLAKCGLDPAGEWRRDRPVPKGAVEQGGTWYQYYLDNFDCPEKVSRHTWKSMVGTLSPVHAKQRAAYDPVGVGISRKKEHIREPCVTRMGAEIDGVEGRLSAPTEKMLEVGWLTIWMLAKPVVSPRMLMVLLGRFTRCFEFRRPLMGLLNVSWPKSMWCRPRKLTSGKAEELLKAAGLLPLACALLRTPVSGLVTCSDASTLGGGMCASSGLTAWGEQCLNELSWGGVDGEFFRPQGSIGGSINTGPRVLVVSLFDGVGSIMCAATRLPLMVRGYASSEIDKDCMRLTRTRWPGIIELGDIRKITTKVIDQLAGSIGYRLDLVLLSAGCPTSDYEQADIWLKEIKRVEFLSRQAFSVPVESLIEAMFPLSRESLDVFNHALQHKPLLVDAKHLSWMRRPRLFWLTWAVTAVGDETLHDSGDCLEWRLGGTREHKQSWVDGEGQWLSQDGILLPDYSSPTPRRSIPRAASGLDEASELAKARWAADSYKLPVKHYESEHMITNADGSLRLLKLVEWEKLMGFDDHYNQGGQLLGGAFNVFVVMVILDELFFSYAGSRNRLKSDFFSRGVAPKSWTQRPSFVKQSEPTKEVSNLVSHSLRVAERGGTDVRLDVGVPFRAKAWPRSGVQSSLFQWAIIHGYSWAHPAHINSVKWRVRRASNCCHRALVLIDSQVVCAIIAKGRTSSGKLRRSLQSLNAVCLAAGLYLTVAYVDTGNNPADIPSRWPNLTLREQQVSPAMSQRYSHAVLAFLTFMADSSLVIQRISQFDDAACAWLEFLYADGQRKGLASDGLAGIQHFLPRCIGRLRQSWKLLKVWQKVEPPMRVLPMSPLILLGMAGLAARLCMPDVSAGLLICFDGMLRSGELYTLAVGDVTFYRQHAVLRLGLTKSGKRTGKEEMVVINSVVAVNWLRVACRNRPFREPLLRKGADHFRKCFKLFLCAFSLEGLLLNVYSLRRGGATWDFLSHQSMERTLLRGRWSSTSSARVYLQDATVMVAHLRLNNDQVCLATTAAQILQTA